MMDKIKVIVEERFQNDYFVRQIKNLLREK